MEGLTFVENFAYERDWKRCRHCGTNENIKIYKIDEKKITRTAGVDNLITLCKDCYNKKFFNEEENVCWVILAGWKGTRMAPITNFLNKHELPVGNRPMVFHPLFTLRELWIKNVLVIFERYNTGRMIEALGNGREFGMEITYRIQHWAGGIADALSLAKDFVWNRNFYVILGDNIFDNNEIGKFKKSVNPKVFIKQVANPDEYWIGEIIDWKINRIIEKPKQYIGNMAVTGLYHYTPDVFDIIQWLRPSWRDELEITDINNYYLKEWKLDYEIIESYWVDSWCNLSSYIEANKIFNL